MKMIIQQQQQQQHQHQQQQRNRNSLETLHPWLLIQTQLYLWKCYLIQEDKTIFMNTWLYSWRQDYIHEDKTIFMKTGLYSWRQDYIHDILLSHSTQSWKQWQPHVHFIEIADKNKPLVNQLFSFIS